MLELSSASGNPTSTDSRADGLLGEITNFKVRTLAANKKLARDVAKWVDTAMGMREDEVANSKRGGATAADLDLAIEDEDEEDGDEDGDGAKVFRSGTPAKISSVRAMNAAKCNK